MKFSTVETPSLRDECTLNIEFCRFPEAYDNNKSSIIFIALNISVSISERSYFFYIIVKFSTVETAPSLRDECTLNIEFYKFLEAYDNNNLSIIFIALNSISN